MAFATRDQLTSVYNQFIGEQLPARPAQSIYAQSAVQNYAIGSRRVDGQRVFRYTRASAALNGFGRLIGAAVFQGATTGHVGEDGYEGVLAHAAVIGQQYVDIADTALRAANYYQGGYVVIYGTLNFHVRRITASLAGTGVYVRCYIEEPLNVEDLTVAFGVTAYRSPYVKAQQIGSYSANFESAIGVNLIPVTIDHYFWLQTAGPAWVTPTGATWPGSAANLRALYFNPADGTVNPATVNDPSAGYQYVGYLISATVDTYGDSFIMLQLDR